MSKNQDTGKMGEEEVIKLVKCPNCKKSLMLLPPNYPLYDAQCTGCAFRAQIKTISSSPTGSFRGAGWEIIDKVSKSGFLMPTLFVNFKWKKNNSHHREIRFYPFIPKENIQKYQLSPTARRANYKMFRYVGMTKLPYFVVYRI